MNFIKKPGLHLYYLVHEPTDEWPVYASALIQLLGRLLRFLASVGTIEEVESDKFTWSDITKTLAIPGVQAVLYHQ